jgi:hypothetical protein
MRRRHSPRFFPVSRFGEDLEVAAGQPIGRLCDKPISNGRTIFVVL